MPGLNRLDELAELVPPPRLTHGHGDELFREIGQKWVETFRLYGGLEPSDHVLDVGCGPGRMALSLAPVLADTGRYEGFDIRREDIRWCRKEIEPRWSASHFRLLKVHNRFYNRRARRSASSLRFPYDDESFDFVFLTSVFTHLLPDDLRNYLGEISRVLRPSGRTLISFYLLDDAVRASIAAGAARFAFAHEISPHCRSQSARKPERAVAYDEGYVRDLYARAGLRIREPIHHGAWSGRSPAEPPRHGQDIVVATKQPPPGPPRRR